MKILCIIPARSGSKGIINKNIKLFNGKPLLAWSIEQAQKSVYTMKIIVSTDSQKYADIAISYDAEAPFLRPENISQDLSIDFEYIKHAIEWLDINEQYVPDIILQLRPTQPTRSVKDIDNCLRVFIEKRQQYDSLRTVKKFEKSPYKMYSISNNILVPLFKKVDDITEPYNQCRQRLPPTYLHDGYIDILNTSIIKEGTISGKNIYPYIIDSVKKYIDIDTEKDWNNAIKM